MALISRAFSFQAPGTDLSQPESLSLRLYLRRGILEYALLNGAGKIVAVREVKTAQDLDDTSTILSFFMNEKELKQNWKDVRFFTAKGIFCLVPEKVYQPDHSEEYLRFLGGNESGEISGMERKLDFPNARIVFAYEPKLKNALGSQFPDAEISPMGAACAGMVKYLSGDRSDGIYVHLSAQRLWVTAIKSGQLRMLNSYDYRDPADVVYYIQLSARVAELGSHPNIWFGGEFDPEGTVFRQVKKLLPQSQIPEEKFRKCFEGEPEKIQAWKYAILAF